jgi:plastocyanin
MISVLFESTLTLAATVVIENMKFNPDTITVKKNETITWVNKDMFPHTATAVDKTFDSKVLQPGKSFKYKAKKTGTFEYKCDLHPTMKASLTVQ